MINLNGVMSPNNHMDRTYGMIGVTVIGGLMSMNQGDKNSDLAEGMARDAKIEKDKQNAALEKEKTAYKAMKFTNPFADMENTFEDLTVNTQQADFQAKQGTQQRANIMQGLRGSAGSSGIAGLAQAMANQGQMQTQQISASIGMQESRNQIATARGAAAIQNSERMGDQYVQQSNIDRQSTLLGMQMGQTAGANSGFMQAQANQMNAAIANQQTTADLMGSLGAAAGTVDFGFGSKTVPSLPSPEFADLSNLKIR